MREYIINAENKSVGRVATEAAAFLMGKDTPAFRKNIAAEVKVTVINAAKAGIHPKKMEDKKYKAYSGYPGGLKETSMPHMIAKKGYGELFRIAVRGMLPRNKLRAIRMKNLAVTE